MPGIQENVACALCYLIPIVTGVLFLFIEPHNRSKAVRFHAFQAIFFWIGVFVADAVLEVVFGDVLGGVSTYGLFHLIWTLFRLAVLVLWLLLMYRAYMRQPWVLPVVGEMAQKLA